MAEHVVGDLVAELADEGGAFRTGSDAGHVTEEDVPELGQFVDRPAAQESADAGAAGVVFRCPDGAGRGLGAHPHRAKLEDHEGAAVEAHPLLAVEERAPVLQLDQQHDDGQEREECDHRGGGENDVHRTLGQARPALHRHVREVDDRCAVNVLDLGAQRGVLEDVRDKADLDQFVADAVEQVEDLSVGGEGQGDHHLVDAVLFDRFFQVLQGAEDTDAAADLGVQLLRIVVEEPDDFIAEFPVADQLGRDLLAAVAGADDQNPAHVVPPAAEPAQEGAGDQPEEGHEEDVGDHEQGEERPAVGEGIVRAGLGQTVEGQDRGQDDQRQHGGDDDADHLVHPAVPAADAVEAVEVVDGGPDQDDERQHPEVGLEVGHRLRDLDHRLDEPQVPGQEEGRHGRGDVAAQIQRGGDAKLLVEHGLQSCVVGAARSRGRSA